MAITKETMINGLVSLGLEKLNNLMHHLDAGTTMYAGPNQVPVENTGGA